MDFNIRLKLVQFLVHAQYFPGECNLRGHNGKLTTFFFVEVLKVPKLCQSTIFNDVSRDTSSITAVTRLDWAEPWDH